MIRFREKQLGTEAVWDEGRWSGDPDLVHLLEGAMFTVGAKSFLPPGTLAVAAQQDIMAQKFPEWGVAVVEQTPPVKRPRAPGAMLDY